ncbi:beta-N-acetylglucosaminidase domain-containing protein [Streptomyces axinellae]|uniref:Hyaluronidase n=1 Tax=Streptomyces axinellae TaxID=552788 RepID=A0ABP6C668_9ACTN
MGAAALTATVASGLIGGAPSAQATPPPVAEGPAADVPDDHARGGLPPVWPRPRAMRERGPFVPAHPEAALIADRGADPYALDVIRETLRAAGVRAVREARAGQAGHEPTPDARPGASGTRAGPGRSDGGSGSASGAAHRPELREGEIPEGSLVVRVGAESAEGALRALHAPSRSGLPRGGYRLAAGTYGGRDTVALEGTGGDGLFHAAQTLRQLVTRRDGAYGFPGVAVHDWPATPVRGTAEGFYGQPWTSEQRLALLDFLGRTKQNHYLYAPGDDPYRQAARWRDPYPAGQRAAFRQLAERAARNHVVLGWAVSPGQNLCFSSAGDRKALLRKLDAMRALGMRSFQLRFEDVSYSEWHCDADADTYGSGPEAAARAQAELANEAAAHLARSHPDAEPLSVVPTEFYQKGRTDYRAALAERLDDRVQIAWSGVGVVPRTITGGELAGSRAAFPRHRLVTLDNYPVNDYAPDRVFLGPYQGRDPAVADGSAALLTNAMEQPVASRIPLFTAADYAWNPRGYRPRESWRAAVEEAAGGPDADPRTRAAVHALAANDASSVLDGAESAYVRPLVAAFWRAYERGDREELARAGARLRTAFSTMRTAPSRVPSALAQEAGPWLAQLSRLGGAGERAVDMVLAQARGDGAEVWRAQLDVRRLRAESEQRGRRAATVGKGVLPSFADKALRLSDAWTGVRQPRSDGGAPASAGSHGSSRPGSGTSSRSGRTSGENARHPADAKDGKASGAPETSGASGSGAAAGSGPSGVSGASGRPGPSDASGASRSTSPHRATGRKPVAHGVPDADPGSPLSSAVDGDPATAYRAAGAPAAGRFAPADPPMLVPPSRGGGPEAAGRRPALTLTLPEARPLRAVTVLTGPGSGTRATVRAHIAGKGWHSLGPLSRTGWTRLTAGQEHGGDPVDALRLVWDEDTGPPVVHEITPWYADLPSASLALPRTPVDAVIGGSAARAHARLTGHRPSDTRGKVTAQAPSGFTVRTPARSTVRHGGTVEVPLRITADSSVKAGTYRMPVSFGGERATLTVRAVPRTSGPDLARAGRARSSADETEDFPAAAVTDGRRGTRWSSPAVDGAWVQVRLARPARVGQVVLHWQDAYASRYRIQVSPDGRRWRTAATVREGRGGKESVRMDAPAGTRFVRVQGDERATRYGISLWSVRIYAVDGGRARHARRAGGTP